MKRTKIYAWIVTILLVLALLPDFDHGQSWLKATLNYVTFSVTEGDWGNDWQCHIYPHCPHSAR